MSNLSFSEGDNLGGIASLQLAPVYAFTSLSPVVTFRDGYTWDDALFLPESAQLTDESIETDNGLQYTYTLPVSFNKKNAGLYAGLRKYLGTVAIAKVTDQNGFCQIIGNLQTPLTIKQNADSGKAPVDQNLVTITASAVQDAEAIIVS